VTATNVYNITIGGNIEAYPIVLPLQTAFINEQNKSKKKVVSLAESSTLSPSL
jgi:hypothetical protein